MYADIWIQGRLNHDDKVEVSADQLQLQAQQRRQIMRNGAHSKFQKLDVVYYHWLVDANSNVYPDGKFYLSVVTYVLFSSRQQQYVYTIHSLDRKWKTNHIIEHDHALFLECELPDGAIIGVE